MSWVFNQPWRKKAACVGVPLDVFFNNTRRNRERAAELCAQCPVTQECLNFALQVEKKQSSRGARFGLYGGLNPNQRALINPCRYSTCLESAPKGKRFCSSEHKKLHEREVELRNLNLVQPVEFYKQGRVYAQASQA